MNRTRLLSSLFLSVAITACAAPDDPIDGEDDTFVTDGKTDVAGIAEGTVQACAVQKLANTADFDTLDDDARLNANAVARIMAYRAGADATLGTDDDEHYDSLDELDDVKYVGPVAFKRMLAYATAQGVVCGTQQVQLLAFNDYHGNLKPPSGSSGKITTGPVPGPNLPAPFVDAGGAEFMATHMKRLAATNPNTVVVAAGDIIGATPLLSAAFHDEPTIESANLMGLAVAGVGNHEFDEGLDELWRMQYGGCHPVDGCFGGDGFGGADFAYLAANVRLEGTDETIFPAVAVRRFGNAQVAFIGMTLEGTPLVTTAAGVAGLTFADEADTVNALVPGLKARGIQTIVVLVHEGGAASGLYNQCAGISGPIFEIASRLDPAVDVIVAGHTNAAHICDVGGKLVTSAAHAGRLITDIDLTIDERTGEVMTRTGDNVIVTRDVAKDADQTALITRYDALIAPIANRVIATIAGDLIRLANAAGESPLGNVIADAQHESTRAAGAVAAFMNPGGIRADILVAQISGGEQAGQVTYAEAFSVQPFGNNLITFTVTGAQLETMLEQQWQLVGGVEKANMLAVSASFSYTWDSTRALGDRIDPATIKIDGVVVNPAASYRITTNSFLADGGDGFAVLRLGTNRAAGPVDLEPLEQYLVSHSPVAVPAIGRVTRL